MQPPVTFDEQIAARTIWAEARGESEEGQRAVAYVIMNRKRSGKWGSSLASVCTWPKQFSCHNDNDPNRIKLFSLAEDDSALARFVGFMRDARMLGMDTTGGAMHYYSASMSASPSWAVRADGSPLPANRIGNHIFVQGVA